MVSSMAAFHAGSYGGLQEKSFVITFQSFTVRVLPLPPQNEIQLLSRVFCYSFIWFLSWGKLRYGMQRKWKLKLHPFTAECTGNVSDLTYSISGAASKVSLSNYYSFCLVLVLLQSEKIWPLGFRLAPGVARLQASVMSKRVRGLPSWSVQLDGPGTALTVGGWIRPGGKNSGVGRGLFWHNPFTKQQCSVEALTGTYVVLTLP